MALKTKAAKKLSTGSEQNHLTGENINPMDAMTSAICADCGINRVDPRESICAECDKQLSSDKMSPG